MSTDPSVVSALSAVAAVALPMATRAELAEIIVDVAPAFELVGGQLRPGPDAHALARANTIAPVLVTAVACQQAGRASMSPAERTLADLRARGLSPSDLVDGSPDGDDVLWEQVESLIVRRGGGPPEAA